MHDDMVCVNSSFAAFAQVFVDNWTSSQISADTQGFLYLIQSEYMACLSDTAQIRFEMIDLMARLTLVSLLSIDTPRSPRSCCSHRCFPWCSQKNESHHSILLLLLLLPQGTSAGNHTLSCSLQLALYNLRENDENSASR